MLCAPRRSLREPGEGKCARAGALVPSLARELVAALPAYSAAQHASGAWALAVLARAHGAAGAAGGRRKTCAAGPGAAAAPDLMLCVRCAVQEPPRCGLGERRRVLQAGWLVRRRRPRPSTRPAREQRGGRRAGAGERTGGAPSRA